MERKREEKLKKAFNRVNHKREVDNENIRRNKFKKTEKIEAMAGQLENKLSGKDDKFYVDLDYEKNKEEEE